MPGVAQDADVGGLDYLIDRFLMRCRSAADPEETVTAPTIEVRYSAIADVGRSCLEGRLCFALPTFDHVPPKILGPRV